MAHRQRPSTKVKIPIAIAKSTVAAAAEFQVNTLLHAQSSDTPYISGAAAAVVFKDQWDLPGRLSLSRTTPRPMDKYYLHPVNKKYVGHCTVCYLC